MKQIYLDYNATTPIAPSVLEAMMPFLNEHFGNPSSNYTRGVGPRPRRSKTRGCAWRRCWRSIKKRSCSPAAAAKPTTWRSKARCCAGGNTQGGHIVISAFEHPSISQPARFLERMGLDVSVVDPDLNGVVQPARRRGSLDERDAAGKRHARQQRNRHDAADRRDRRSLPAGGRADTYRRRPEFWQDLAR